MKKPLLLITVVLLAMSSGIFGQNIGTGNNSSASYYICNSGSVQANGWNAYGQLGDGTEIDKLTPVEIDGLSGITSIASGWGFAIFLKNDGTVWACGSNYSGQIGSTPSENLTIVPTQIGGLSGITAIAAGSDHSLFLKNDGTVWACGRNSEKQLGNGTSDSTGVPTQVIGLTDITKIAAGVFNSFFIKNDGTVWACGWNGYGQLGDGTNVGRSIPVQLSGLSDIIDVSGGNAHTLFLKNDGSVWACGDNGVGQFGNGSYTDSYTPIQVTTLSDITAVKAGYSHSLFLKSDGTPWGSGANAYGQIGNGTVNTGPNPTQVTGLTNITEIAAGRSNSVFLKNDGSVYATGYNSNGQVGDGTLTTRVFVSLIIAAGECQVVGVEQVNNQFSSLKVYPNPTKNSIIIDSEVHSQKSFVKIFNATGQEVLQSSTHTFKVNHKTSLDVSSLFSGIYFIRFFDGKNEQQAKFVKE